MTDAPERLWAWCFNTPEHGGWNSWGGYARREPRHPLDDRERRTGAEYIRADATFTADDLRRAFAIAIEMAAEQMWANAVDSRDHPQAAKVVPALVATTIKVFANMPPPDDLAARVNEGRDE